MFILKIILLQLFWLGAVIFSSHPMSYLFWPLGLILLGLNYKIYNVSISKSRYVFFIIIFSAWGFAQDGLLEITGSLEFNTNTIWLNSLWLVFLCYFGDVLNKILKLNILLQALLGGVGGVLTYWSGCRLAGVSVVDANLFMTIVFISWFLFFPLMIYLFYNKHFWNWFLDRTVYFSFDSSGYLRHAEDFNLSEKKAMLKDKNILVTGGTGGIGRDACEKFSENGASIVFTGRNEVTGNNLSSENKQFCKLDMVNWEEIEKFTDFCGSFDGIVLNAGGMPDDRYQNKQGIEHQAASQLFGHYYLIDLLRQKNKLNTGCRITWVSSGGMYFKKLDLENLILPNNYEKVDTYANVKRSQITLVEEMVKTDQWGNYTVTTMHPGWVATDGIKDAIPGFYKFMKNRLRNIEQGADTIVWLQYTQDKVNSGAFYFDRQEVSAYISKKYIPTLEQREALVSLLSDYKKRFINV